MRLSHALLAFGTACASLSAVPLDAARAAEKIPFPNPGTVAIADPSAYSAVYAISDVHGMSDALAKLLRENSIVDASGHWSAGSSLLVVVGDSIDKGPQSVDVIDTWMRLEPEAKAAGGRLVVLLGNHEAEFLHDPTNHKTAALQNELKRRGMSTDELADPKYPRGQWMRGLPIAARVGDWVFCHAGYLPKGGWRELSQRSSQLLSAGRYGNDWVTGDDSILEAKEWWEAGSDTREKELKRLDDAGLAGVVFGHQPKALGAPGVIAASDDHRLIKIDNGMAPEAGSHPGSLLLFSSPAELGARSGVKIPTMFALVGGKRQGLASEGRKAPRD
jgi:hypothetical protein